MSKPILFNFALLSMSIVLFNISCNTAKPILTPEQELRTQILKYPIIPVTISENGKEKKINVPRSKIDTLDAQLTEDVNQYISNFNDAYPHTVDFVFIKYYPGQDSYNSTGNATRASIGKKNKKFKAYLALQENIIDLNFYKNDEGISRWDKNIVYHHDANQTIESTFFEYHYPGSSYVVLHKTGVYYAAFGESWMERQIKDVNLFMQINYDNTNEKF